MCRMGEVKFYQVFRRSENEHRALGNAVWRGCRQSNHMGVLYANQNVLVISLVARPALAKYSGVDRVGMLPERFSMSSEPRGVDAYEAPPYLISLILDILLTVPIFNKDAKRTSVSLIWHVRR